jgi:hypothetical protein
MSYPPRPTTGILIPRDDLEVEEVDAAPGWRAIVVKHRGVMVGQHWIAAQYLTDEDINAFIRRWEVKTAPHLTLVSDASPSSDETSVRVAFPLSATRTG